jgi:SHS2 domain-containing protein
MVRWLAELNFRHVTRHELYCQFNVQGWNDQQLTAEVAGERVDTARHTLYTEIKAVTFHGLRIEQAGAGWQAQIIFDL